ncbi:MAG: hypothetical protein CL424_09865 [Acidimicrobiaceae bacterium]|nr:hypothetical protein [Acidimicrobiaceae bacterium]
MLPPPPPVGDDVFRSGLATGDVDTTSVVLWTRAAPPAAIGPTSRGPLRWSLWTEGGDQVEAGVAEVGPEHDHTCHVRVGGLEPGTTYHVVFEAFGSRITGTTTTLPTNATRFRIAVACCSRWGWPGFETYGRIDREEPDLVLHVGDYIYEIGETTPTGRMTDPPHDCTTLDDYRRRHAQHRTDDGLRRLHANRPFLAVWDDHEVIDNAPDDESMARRAAGIQAWQEWMPVDPDAAGLDRVRSIGGLIDLVVVDARFGGRLPTDTDGPSVGRADGPILSDAQWELVERAVEASTAPWFVVANQVQVSPMTLAYAPALQWPPWRRVVNPDQWDGFPAERRRLADLLGRAHGRPVIVSGDLHAGWSRGFLDDAGTSIAHEFTSPSISGVTYAEAVHDRTRLPSGLVHTILTRLNPGIDHLDLDRHGFLLLDVTADTLTTTFVHTDGTRVVRTLTVG